MATASKYIVNNDFDGHYVVYTKRAWSEYLAAKKNKTNTHTYLHFRKRHADGTFKRRYYGIISSYINGWGNRVNVYGYMYANVTAYRGNCIGGLTDNYSFPSASNDSHVSSTVMPPLVATAQNRALNELGSAVDVLTFYATRKDTFSLLAGTVRNTAELIRALKRGDWRKCLDITGVKPSRKVKRKKLVADRWLAYSYGWAPMLGDAYNAAEQLARQGLPYNEFTVSKKASSDTSSVSQGRYRSTDGGYEVFTPYTQITEWKRKAKCTFRYSVDLNSAAYRAQAWNLLNPLTVAWELIPWSFVVDWFVNVGDLLANTTATVGKRFICGSVTTIEEYDSKVISSLGGTHHYTSKTFQRSPLSSFPRMTLQTTSPLEAFSSWKRDLNALSLLVSQFSKSPRVSNPKTQDTAFMKPSKKTEVNWYG